MSRRGNNEGSITKRPDGRWMARVSMPDGTRRVAYGKSRAEVQEKLKDLLKQAAHAARLTAGQSYKTVGDFLDVWLINVAPSVKLGTAIFYRNYLKRYAGDIRDISITQFKPQHVQQLYARLLERGLSSTTVRLMHSTLHRAFDSAVKQGIFVQNPCDLIDAPRIAQKQMKFLTADQARVFLEGVKGDRYEALYVLAISTGMRRGELLGLTWEDVDLDRGLVFVRKSLQFLDGAFVVQEPKSKTSKRRIFIGPLARQALADHRMRQDREREVLAWEGQQWNLLFTTLKGSPLRAEGVGFERFKILLKRSNLPEIRFHDLRHTAATLLLEAGINPKVVSEMLGHSSVAITLSLYSHTTPGMHYTASMVMDKVLRGEINPLALPEGLEDVGV